MEQRKKGQKLRSSIKLSKLPSFRSSMNTRRPKSRFDSHFFDSSPKQWNILEHDVGASPDHMKKESSPQSLVESAHASPNYLKGTSSSIGRKAHIEASPSWNSESSFAGSDYSESTGSLNSQSISASSTQRSMKTFTRRASLRTARFLKNRNSFKSKRTLMKYGNEIPNCSSINRATCSSTLKGLKFLALVELQPGQRNSAMKVCPYHHCSLNGHSREPIPPLKHYISKRRHSLKTQKSVKYKGHSIRGRRRTGDENEETETSFVHSSVASMVGEEFASSNSLGNCNNHSIHKGKNANLTSDVCSPALSLKASEQVNISNEKVPHLASKLYEDESSTSANRSIQNYNGESTENNCEPASTSDALVEPRPDREQIYGSYKPDNESVASCFPVTASQSKSSLRKAYKHPLGKEKHISMWYLIHQHMVSGLTAEPTIQPLQGKYEEKRMDDGTISTLSSASDFSSESVDCNGMGHSQPSNQDIELQKMFAVKLVREAIEKILIPEVQEQMLDDQSVKGDASTQQEVSEINYEGSFNESLSECDDNKVLDDKSFSSKEETFTASRSPKEDKTERKVENNSGKPKGWSNLKKLLLLRRFIKELEKVKKINLLKPNYLPSEQEQENVSLRHQMMGERRSSEEWMLDYALKQVISQLAPTQKKKVSLLVKAFETVVPTQEDCHRQVSFPKLKGNIQKGSCIRSELDGSVSEATDGDHMSGQIVSPDLGNAIPTDKRFNSSQRIVQDPLTKVQLEFHEDSSLNLNSRLLIGSSGLNATKDEELGNMKEVNGEPCVESDATKKTASTLMAAMVGNKSFQTDHAIPKGFCSDKVSNLNSELLTGGYRLSKKGDLVYKPQSSTPDGSQESTASEKIGFSNSDSKTLKQLSSVREVVLQESNKVIGSKTDGIIKTQNAHLDKRNHLRMWHMIYQHVVSGIAEKVGNQLLLDESDVEEERDASNLSPLINDSGFSHHHSQAHLDTRHDRKNGIHQKNEFTRTDAIKLVQEEVDEILYPEEAQNDTCDTHSNASDIILQERELLEKTRSNGGDLISISTFAEDRLEKYDRNKVGDVISLHEEAKESSVDNISTQKDEKSDPLVTKRPVQHKSKNWSNLKKIILLKRSIMALERSRKLTTQPPHNLPVTPEQEAEKVSLRHKMSEERKKAEQWMLDYAVQHIVTKLSPSRKRRVAMLVEAFEAVVPLPDV